VRDFQRELDPDKSIAVPDDRVAEPARPVLNPDGDEAFPFGDELKGCADQREPDEHLREPDKHVSDPDANVVNPAEIVASPAAMNSMGGTSCWRLGSSCDNLSGHSTACTRLTSSIRTEIPTCPGIYRSSRFCSSWVVQRASPPRPALPLDPIFWSSSLMTSAGVTPACTGTTESEPRTSIGSPGRGSWFGLHSAPVPNAARPASAS
jgi:hypothetical protein